MANKLKNITLALVLGALSVFVSLVNLPFGSFIGLGTGAFAVYTGFKDKKSPKGMAAIVLGILGILLALWARNY